MNTKQIPKLKLMLSAILSRLNDNLEYFREIEVIFKSGRKDFPMTIKYSDEGFICNFLGENKKIIKQKISDVIINSISEYDSLLIKYKDRFSSIILICDDKNVTMKQSDDKNESEPTATVSGRNYIIKSNKAAPLLKEIGIMAENGKIKNDMIRKYNQIDRFVELISDIETENNINIMDCGCGKSYLSFVLNYYYTEICKKKCRVYGIDYNKSVIEASKKTASNLQYDNMEFISADLRELNLKKKIDIVISLHACDIATDYAIYSGLKHNAKAIICIPCCHKELMNQINSSPIDNIIKYGVYKNRFCDMLTDTMRSLILESMGYKVSVIEYVSPLDTPKNVMIKAVKYKETDHLICDEYYKLKEMFHVSPTLEKLIQML